ncbi:TIGR02266 family protein [Corallococcus sp. bb12-1]|uniref:TIGR02266 family protein n=1 Tax=Corallococcus terminator TaxID=2316733 RepID=A0A3A8IUP9_9BACT|nr:MULTISPECIES: TIGR02266 family protein [Corallococcus]MCY1041759.1 TIGR02266 family protein [Corallococcus sp. bb12-1]RKG86478.1 TIGR02266 family protein [Corallococcus terminator]
MSENRKHARVGTHLRCWCEGENVTLYARISNLSEGGLFLRTSTPLAKGSRAQVRLSQETDAALRAEATVVWLRGGEQPVGRPPGMGLRFEALDANALASLRRIISQQQTSP